jgi:hypothetical protein
LTSSPTSGSTCGAAAWFFSTTASSAATRRSASVRDTCHVVTWFNAEAYVRKAPEDDLSNVPVCGHCLNQTGIFVGNQPLVEQQGRLDPDRLGSAVEMNRRRHR